ncbi:MAG: histidine phosphatase family protein [Rubripirellula sp.]
MTEQNEDNPRFLILMRHAKSDWDDASLSDHDRPLNDRGRRAAPAMARWLEQQTMIPDLILSSTSTRTRETVDRMVEQWATPPNTHFQESLYLAGADTILNAAKEHAGDVSRVMVVAHNPGMAYVVGALSQKHADMPTAAIAIFQLHPFQEWSDLDANTPMELVHSMRPKAL